MEVSSQLHAPATLSPGYKAPSYPLNRRLGGPQSRYGRSGEETNLLLLSFIEPQFLGRPAHSQSIYRPNYSRS
jgi:hypothetical protein